MAGSIDQLAAAMAAGSAGGSGPQGASLYFNDLATKSAAKGKKSQGMLKAYVENGGLYVSRGDSSPEKVTNLGTMKPEQVMEIGTAMGMDTTVGADAIRAAIEEKVSGKKK